MRFVIAALICIILLANMYAMTAYAFFGSQVGVGAYYVKMQRQANAETVAREKVSLDFYERYIKYNMYGPYWAFVLFGSVVLFLSVVWLVTGSFMYGKRTKIILFTFGLSA